MIVLPVMVLESEVVYINSVIVSCIPRYCNMVRANDVIVDTVATRMSLGSIS